MNSKEITEQLGKLGIDGIKEISIWIEGAKDFVSEQSPLICQEIVNRGIIQASIGVIVFTILFITCIFVIRWANKTIAVNKEDKDPLYALIGLSIAVLGGMFAGMCVQTYTLFYINYCQRLYVLEQLAEIVKSATN